MLDKTIIEINGVKLEVDLRNAKRIDQFKVGDNVKVLIKQYGDNFTSYPGVIVGFDHFEARPTIVICYMDANYNASEIKFCYFNKDSKDIEICHMGDHEKTLEKERCIDYLDRSINKMEFELDQLKRKKNYFLEHYNKHFSDYQQTEKTKCQDQKV